MTLLTPRFLPTKTYPFQDLRHLIGQMAIQEGVLAAGDLKPSQRAAGGANMSVDVAAGVAWVQGDDVARQGLYNLVNDALVNVAVPAAHGSLPRIDQVVARVYDSAVLGSSDTPAIEVIQGTATSGATLDNRTGAAALPNGAVRLADVLVPAASTSVVDANIRSRRPWARGAHRRIVRNQVADYTTTVTSTAAAVAIDSTNLSPRIECSGAPVHIRLQATISHSAAQGKVAVELRYDPTTPGTFVNPDGSVQFGRAANAEQTSLYEWESTPSPGSHLFRPYFWGDVGTSKVYADAANGNKGPIIMEIAEIVRQDAENT